MIKDHPGLAFAGPSCVSGMCINYRVKVPNAPLQWEALAKIKCVHREVESERRWRQKFEPTNRNCIQGVERWAMLQFKQKPDTVRNKLRRCRGYMN
jgi:hypothetical protein